MGKRSKRQKYKLDPKKFEAGGSQKKEKDPKGEDLFNEALRGKPGRRR